MIERFPRLIVLLIMCKLLVLSFQTHHFQSNQLNSPLFAALSTYQMHVLLFYPPVKAVPVPVKSTTASPSSSPSSSLSPSSSSSHSNTEGKGKGKGKGDAERSDDVKILDLDFELPTACTSEEGGDENGVCAFLKTLHPEETTPHAETNTDMNMGGSEDGEGGSEGGGDGEGHLDPLMTVEKALSGTAEQFRGRSEIACTAFSFCMLRHVVLCVGRKYKYRVGLIEISALPPTYEVEILELQFELFTGGFFISFYLRELQNDMGGCGKGRVSSYLIHLCYHTDRFDPAIQCI